MEQLQLGSWSPEPDTQPRPVISQPSSGGQVSACYFKTLRSGAVGYAALLQQLLSNTLLYKVASFLASQLLALKKFLVQLDLKLLLLPPKPIKK